MKKPASLDSPSGLLDSLKGRFLANMARHPGMDWDEARTRLENSPDALRTLAAMEASGGEPDVIGTDADSGAIIFCDCSAESPSGRRSLCYDDAALAARKEHKPAGNAAGLALSIGAELLSEDEYRILQERGAFDQKTSTWLRTPPAMRALGGALFGDRRYDRVFVYHNGAESYYAARGVRFLLKV
ncbi:MAG: DUF4256 domain-containing protein [Spirochaetales bacterium]|nr:DUF4256 domain-containing protein [Spirochaetales bacterium]